MNINYETRNLEFSRENHPGVRMNQGSFTPIMLFPLYSITECYTRSLKMNLLRGGNLYRSGQVSVVFDFNKIPVRSNPELIKMAGGRPGEGRKGKNKILIHPITNDAMGDSGADMNKFHTKILKAAKDAGATITRIQAGGGKKSRRRKTSKRRKYNKRRKSTKRKYTKRRKSKTRRRRR